MSDSRGVVRDAIEAIGRIPSRIAKSWSLTDERGGFLWATLIGWVLELLYGITSQGFIGGVRVFCLLWFASGAAFFIGTIAGFLFGVPRARSALRSESTTSAVPTSQAVSTEVDIANTYRDNTNLEEVSDWLTKIIVGISLAEFSNIIGALDQIGEQVGVAVDPSGKFGGKVIAIGSIIIGFSTGFLYYYVWARMVLRRGLVAWQLRAVTEGQKS